VDSRISKEDLILQICNLLEISNIKMSTGSTEPKELFLSINEILGLAIPKKTSKPEMAKQIVELAGGIWTTECESIGGTVTQIGLGRVRDAVSFFTNSESGEKE
jgi:hypothetical protein